MPSVDMRRTTRVFGVVKGVDGDRVLRSGRRLFPGSGDGKFRRANDGDEWLHTMIKANSNSNKNHHNNSTVKCKENGWTRPCKLKQGNPGVNDLVPKRAKSENLNDTTERKKFGLVYSRKRRRYGEEKLEHLDRKKFGIQFSRRQRRRNHYIAQQCARLAIVAVGTRSVGLASFLLLVFGYMRKGTLRLSHLASFLSDEPVSNAFASSGIQFLQGSTDIKTGICKIFGVRCTVPIFSLGFSAVPSFFLYMHLRLLSIKCLSDVPANTTLEDSDESSSESEKESSSVVREDSLSEIGNSENKLVLHPSVRASKLAGRHTQYRNGLNSRGVQKRRSSLRRKKAINLSMIGVHKANGALVSDLVSSRKNGIPFSSVVSKKKLNGVQSSAASSMKVASPPAAIVAETRAMDTSSCSTNVLVIESDRCHRIEGASVTLETSDSKEWVVAVKKDGLTRYTHLAQKVMRPCSFNRVTHDIIWTGDENWKLEFPNRQDWVIFKDLYKECSYRNVPAPVSKAIPVPRVSQVVGYGNNNSAPFSRPEVYISVNADEVARALARRSAIYDMDSEDEEWLTQLNSGLFLGTEPLSEDNFELMIDAFEKATHCCPDDFADEKAAVNLCTELGRRELVEAVYGYWMRKRKQRRSTLLRVFQGHLAKKAPLIPKPILKKRRSFKRHSSQFGRGKQPSLLQAMAAEHDALEEQNGMCKVEAAQTSAKLAVESAIVKRSRAQKLMENADLAIYKATMALRIAEAARCSTTDAAVAPLLD